jgi:hypothetical protein
MPAGPPPRPKPGTAPGAGMSSSTSPPASPGVHAIAGAVAAWRLVPVASWDHLDPGWPEQVRAAVVFAMTTAAEVGEHAGHQPVRSRRPRQRRRDARARLPPAQRPQLRLTPAGRAPGTERPARPSRGPPQSPAARTGRGLPAPRPALAPPPPGHCDGWRGKGSPAHARHLRDPARLRPPGTGIPALCMTRLRNTAFHPPGIPCQRGGRRKRRPSVPPEEFPRERFSLAYPCPRAPRGPLSRCPELRKQGGGGGMRPLFPRSGAGAGRSGELFTPRSAG